ncbi:hypothetical protein [Alteribacter populi]|uniref:hypothetical protein n=1 Tax=Alteribacter populi TaxID=2011011 RepID=UPI0012FF8789|nr:hypothetical protein [Alteribacter populi]
MAKTPGKATMVFLRRGTAGAAEDPVVSSLSRMRMVKRCLRKASRCRPTELHRVVRIINNMIQLKNTMKI